MAQTLQVAGNAWEAAYLRFETREQEIRKFLRRLRRMGADRWRRNARILDLFCGSGGGLLALERLGFTNVEGVDFSPALLERYHGPFRCHCLDCRDLAGIETGSKDIVIVQGGLHHLPSMDRDVRRVLKEASRVLGARGRLTIVEPWRTPFLTLVNTVCRNRLARRLSRRVDALAVMNEEEGETFETWLRRPKEILTLLEEWFTPCKASIAWGKLLWVGERRR